MTDRPITTSPQNGSAKQALYRRFRAQTFADMVGQAAVVQTLRNAVRLGRVGHGFLFVGPRGTGKTSMARILAKAVNCTDLRDGEPCDACPSCVSIREGRALDVIELDAASNNKVDDMRELVPRVYTGAADLRRKVFIIDEVQRIKEGWDVLLKTLEEPPEGVLFIFCTTDPARSGRPSSPGCSASPSGRSPVPEIDGKLRRILDAEGRDVEPAAVALIAQLAGGGMRDAESMLDQVLVSADDPITPRPSPTCSGLAEPRPWMPSSTPWWVAMSSPASACSMTSRPTAATWSPSASRSWLAFGRRSWSASRRFGSGPWLRPATGGGRAPPHRHRRQPQRPGRLPLAARALPAGGAAVDDSAASPPHHAETVRRTSPGG